MILHARLSNQPSNPCPPIIRLVTKSVNLINYLKTDWVYRANSLVGQIIKALLPRNKQKLPTIQECCLSLLRRGMMKAAVFPLPVLLQTTTSRPSRMQGIALRCTGVGTLYPLVITALKTGPIRFIDWKPPDFFFFVISFS